MLFAHTQGLVDYSSREYSMISKHYMTAIFAIVMTASLPFAYASSGTSFEVKQVGDSVIDLNSLQKDRTIRAYVQFSDFDLNDKFFTMQVVDANSGDLVRDFEIQVGSNASGLVDFNSFVTYLVSDEALENEDVETGDYEMQISTRDGSVTQSIPFSIVDSRGA